MSLCEKREEEEDVHTHETAAPESSCVSVKSDESIENPRDLKDGAVTPDSEVKSDDVIRSVTFYLTRFVSYCRNFLGWQNTEALQTHKLLKENADLQHNSHQPVDDVIKRVRDQYKTSMKNKYESLFEGIALEENETPLNWIYTQLYIIEGEIEGVNKEYEVLQMEKTARTQDTPIYCNDIFKPIHEPGCEEKDKIKTVLTIGIAGIGKTVSVQKFILDWAEEKANQDVDFMFVLPFRELNLIKDHQYSLHRLLLDFYPELQNLDSKIFEESKVVFIFDGLDESRIPLTFSDDERVLDMNKSSSVGVLMSNLIRGELLPSALIWITSRPAAANQISSKYINRVTEIQGFNESQREEYFRKRISDEHEASRIISHIRRSRSLHIMCHIPVFCWISATVLQNLLKQDESAEIPQTLTEMYIHFLLTQINMRNQKYDEKDPEKLLKSNRRVIVKLAELAFSQLMKGNVVFYEEDLIESGIDVTNASVYSQIFKAESVIHQSKVYSFIHLSFQQFLAAFFVFYSNVVKNRESLHLFLDECNCKILECCLHDILHEILIAAVNELLHSKNGHLDHFLRFLMGFSLESNQRLLTHTVNNLEKINEITQYIKDQIKGDECLSADRCNNLFLCLMEMNDQTLYKEIQELVKSENHSVNKLSTSYCSTIAYMLQISEVLDEFDLKKYNTSDEGKERLILAVVNCRKAMLADCNLTGQCCKSLSSSLQSSNSLRELDLSHNDLDVTEVELLSIGLKSSHCQLNILRLTSCKLTGQCCKSLSSFLQSSNSLRELDLSNNDLQDSGVKLLSDGLKSSNCQLNILRLSRCMVTEEGCSFLASALSSNPSHLQELDLSYNHPGQSLIELLSDPNYKLEKLKLTSCKLTGQCCKSLSSFLQSSNSLRELDLSNNDLQDSGVKLLSDGLKSSNCQLNILRLSRCMVTEEGCSFLASALSSNPSHLQELDLSYNHPGQSLIELLSDPNYKLEKLNVEHGGAFRITEGPQKYACDLTLDLNTAGTFLTLSEMNRKVTHATEKQPYPDHSERFDEWCQVLCRESLTGRCYWEAEWSERADISVTYKGISRKRWCTESLLGHNEKSWSLNCFDNKFIVRHNKYRKVIPAPLRISNRVGVYLDWSSGTLSFYSVSDTHTLTHLHTFNTKFTEPLYAGFGLYPHLSVSLC